MYDNSVHGGVENESELLLLDNRCDKSVELIL
jgi:hypothetical protein